MRSDSPLSSVNVVLVMAYGSLVFVLLFIFVKRQIMRFAMKSRRGPHVPLGHNAPKELRQEIDSRLSKVQEIRFEPRLLSEQDDRLLSGGCYDYLYRMRALDAIRDSGKSSPAVSPWPVHLTVIISVQQHPLLGHYVVTMVYLSNKGCS
eukprot:XP_014039508.1 PREDICTED: uncharacterized protein C1orf43 homolog [Salmo salar]